MTAGDPQAVAALCQPDGYWRDIVSFPWHLRTYTGTDEIGAAFAATLPDTRPHAGALRRPRRDRLPAGLGEDGTGIQRKYWRRGGGYYLNVGCSARARSSSCGCASATRSPGGRPDVASTTRAR